MSAGFTAVDTLALGAMGHVVGVGAVLTLKARAPHAMLMLRALSPAQGASLALRAQEAECICALVQAVGAL